MFKSLIVATAVGILGFTSPSAAPAAAPKALDSCELPQVVVHRGGAEDTGYTENTLNAYKIAYKYGLQLWETDIRWDAANKPVLMHDATINRTTNGTGDVTDTTWSTSTVKMDDGTNLKDQGLAQLLTVAGGYGARLLIEPKVLPSAAQAANVVALIDAAGMRDRVIINSFEVTHLAPFKAIAPDLEYSLVSSQPLPAATVKAVGDTYNVGITNLTQAQIDSYHALGIEVYAWTVDTPAEWAPKRTWGIDRYVSNKPITYRAWRDWVCTGEVW